MPSIEELSVAIEYIKKDIKELNKKTEDINNFKMDIFALSQSVTNLTDTVKVSNEEMNKAINKLAEIVEKQQRELENQKRKSDEIVEDFSKKIEDVKRAPERKAYEENKEFWKVVKTYAIQGIIYLLILGAGAFIGNIASDYKNNQSQVIQQSK
jgi:chromosome segregation ATPase